MGSSVAMQVLALLWLVILYPLVFRPLPVEALGCNWGTRASHPLPPAITVRLLQDNGFDKVKLFEPDDGTLKALGRSGIQVMLGIPNEFLTTLAASVSAAESWVVQNVSSYVSKYGVDIRYVAVGNEPFLKTYKGKFLATTFPAVQNVQAALVKAGLAHQVKVTVPLNADVYESPNGLPSAGNFRSDISTLMVNLVRFLADNGGVLTINIYPFLSLFYDPHFPLDYAFFPAPGAAPSAASVQDGGVLYTNVFDANIDTLVSALEKHGLGNMTVVVGEIGWPTDGDPHANVENARKFNQGLFNRILEGKGSPKLPQLPDVYVFALLDEDNKSIEPGNFERHWGIFYYDGMAKYDLALVNGRSMVPAKGVKYLQKQWCMLRPEVSETAPDVAGAVGYACTYSDCTSLSYGSSCGSLDTRSNISYAFNQFYQTFNQQKGACTFNNLSVVTADDPSQGTCRFEIMIDIGRHDLRAAGAGAKVGPWSALLLLGLAALMVV